MCLSVVDDGCTASLSISVLQARSHAEPNVAAARIAQRSLALSDSLERAHCCQHDTDDLSRFHHMRVMKLRRTLGEFNLDMPPKEKYN
jgi:hypothetical protein